MVHFKGYSEKDVVENVFCIPQKSLDSSVHVEQDQLLTEIFAPDPITGRPRADLHFMYANDKSPAVADYIRNVLVTPISSSSVMLDSADDALSMTKTRTESNIEYVERLQSIIKGE